MLKAVIFDLDGVITDTAELHYKAWESMAKSVNININRKFNEELKGVSRLDSLNKILAFGGMLNQYSDEQKAALAETKNNEYVELLSVLTPNHILPGIQDFLDTLKGNNVKIGLASASKNGPTILNYLQISDYFDTVVNPDLLENGKPAPDIFLKAAADLDVLPAECIGIEDSEAGIHAIKDAGMFAVGVGTVEVMEQAGADLVLENTKELAYQKLLKAMDSEHINS